LRLKAKWLQQTALQIAGLISRGDRWARRPYLLPRTERLARQLDELACPAFGLGFCDDAQDWLSA
jgi:hypothetical protein